MDHRVDVLFYPSVRFQTADGRTVEFQNKIGTNVPPGVGDEVTIIYDPARPEEAKVALGSMFKFNPKAAPACAGPPEGGSQRPTGDSFVLSRDAPA